MGTENLLSVQLRFELLGNLAYLACWYLKAESYIIIIIALQN